MIRWLCALGSLLLVGLVAFGAWSLLPACGVAASPTWLSFCPSDQAIALRQRLSTLNAEHAELTRAIAFLERELAARQCTAAYPASWPVQPAFTPGNLRSLSGCWQLEPETEYSAMTSSTGAVTVFDDWEICFDGAGRGEQELISNDGRVRCGGPAAGRFDDDRLVITSPTRTRCSDGIHFYERVGECSLNDNGLAATCEFTFPRDGSSSTVLLRRAEGDD